VSAAALNADGRELVRVVSGNRLVIDRIRHAVDSPGLARVASGSLPAAARAVAFDGEATVLVVLDGDVDSERRVIAVHVDRRHQRIREQQLDVEPYGAAYDVVFVPGAQTFAIGTNDGVVAVARAANGSFVESSRFVPPSEFGPAVYDLEALGGSWLATPGYGGVAFWSVTHDGSPSEVRQIVDSSSLYNDAAFDSTGRYLVVGGKPRVSADRTGLVQVWDLSTPSATLVADVPRPESVIEVERCGRALRLAQKGSLYELDRPSAVDSVPRAIGAPVRGFIQTLSCAGGVSVMTSSGGLTQIGREPTDDEREKLIDSPLLVRQFADTVAPRALANGSLVVQRGNHDSSPRAPGEATDSIALRFDHGRVVSGAASGSPASGCAAWQSPRPMRKRCGSWVLRVAKGDGAAVRIETPSGRLLGSARTRSTVSAFALDPNHRMLFVGTFLPEEPMSLYDVSDPTSPSEIITLPLGIQADRAAFSGDGQLLGVEFNFQNSSEPRGTVVLAVGDRILGHRACSLGGRPLRPSELRLFGAERALACRD
jgi:hypothetical protein